MFRNINYVLTCYNLYTKILYMYFFPLSSLALSGNCPTPKSLSVEKIPIMIKEGVYKFTSQIKYNAMENWKIMESLKIMETALFGRKFRKFWVFHHDFLNIKSWNWLIYWEHHTSKKSFDPNVQQNWFLKRILLYSIIYRWKVSEIQTRFVMDNLIAEALASGSVW